MPAGEHRESRVFGIDRAPVSRSEPRTVDSCSAWLRMNIVAWFAGLTSADIAATSILHVTDTAFHGSGDDAAVRRMQQTHSPVVRESCLSRFIFRSLGLILK